MKIQILRKKSDKTFMGYVISAMPVMTENPNHEYLTIDVNEEDYKKIENGWEVSFDAQDKVKLVKPQELVDRENEKVELNSLKTKLKNDTATLDDIKKLLKLQLK